MSGETECLFLYMEDEGWCVYINNSSHVIQHKSLVYCTYQKITSRKNVNKGR